MADYEQAIALNPSFALAYFDRGLAYAALKEYQKSISDWNQAIGLHPNFALAYYNRGLAYDYLNEYSKALADYDQAIALDPNYAPAYYNRGLSYFDQEQHQRAIADFDRTIELDPNDNAAYYNRGLASLCLKNTIQAEADYRHTYELDPTNIRAAWMAEWVGFKKQRPGEETARRLEMIAASNPHCYEARICQGVALGLRGNVKEGLGEVDRAISLEPQKWDAYFWQGMLCAYFYKERHRLAIEAIDKSLEVGLPPVLLAPLHWLEEDRPIFFEWYAISLLEKYGV
jgi:tetratricopeptide (TPR) repeat protein